MSLSGDCSTTTLDPTPDPGCPGGEHPPQPFASVTSSATDSFGNLYVASGGVPVGGSPSGAEAWIDIFNPEGEWITEISRRGAKMIAVDSEGRLYVRFHWATTEGYESGIDRFDPTTYEPEKGNISYPSTGVYLGEFQANCCEGIAVSKATDRLYLDEGSRIGEYGSAAEGNVFLAAIGEAQLQQPYQSNFVAIDASNHRIYASQAGHPEPSKILIFDEEAPHQLIGEITGSETPNGKFFNTTGSMSIAPMESNGHVFVDDIEKAAAVYEFDESGKYVSTITHGFKYVSSLSAISVDNGTDSPNQDYLFVPSVTSAQSHLYAFAPFEAFPPVIEGTSADVNQTEALLRAMVKPGTAATHYVFEYTTQARFAEAGFSDASVAGEGTLTASQLSEDISARVTGLTPGKGYRFRVRAESECQPGGCSDEAASSFTTFAVITQVGNCSNADRRSGVSASLPDCRAYELVTPPDTNGRQPYAPASSSAGFKFGTPPASADGNRVGFLTNGGVIPGMEGAGGFNGDEYLATRTANGWRTTGQSPTGDQSSNPAAGGVSPDLGYVAWQIANNGSGSLLVDGETANYIRHPDGSFHLIGKGTLQTDLGASLHYIGPAAQHAYFTSKKQLEESAPGNGTDAIYDLHRDGTLTVVSLLPGNLTPSSAATYLGSSTDGSTVAFAVNETVYVRVNASETLEAAPAGATFGGLSAEGRYLVYRSGGDLYRFDSQSAQADRLTDSGDAIPINVSSKGTGVYFLSPSILGNGPNPSGDEPIDGGLNLYRWSEGQVEFVGTVTKRDAEGESSGGIARDGLEMWGTAVREGAYALDPSRSDPAGTSLLFESRANLTNFDSGGFAEVYLYDSVGDSLRCISCDPTGSIPGGDATLASVGGGIFGRSPVTRFAQIPNLSNDGRRAIFETPERLVAQDNDGVKDVYEWEASGKGSCATPGGCLFLISSGQSSVPNFIFGASADGSDVFFRTTDLLVTADQDETPSVYDARVEGGFAPPESPAGECLGEACQPAAKAPSDPPVVLQGAGNVPTAKKPRCRGMKQKGHPARKGCVRRHHHERHKAHHKDKSRRAPDGRPTGGRS